jgi:hypothetical protein
MGISNVAIKTFNSTGSQSVCRANKYVEDTLIESDFLTKCNTKYINGTGQTVVIGSMTGFPTGSPSQSTNQDIFDLPDDIDAISNIILTGRMSFDIPVGSDAGNNPPSFANSTAVYFSNTFLLTLIHKLEIKLGGLIVDTLTPDAIFARNLTETNNPCVMSGSTDNSGEYPNIFTNVNNPNTGNIGTASIKDNIIEWSISIPFTGRSSKMNSAFLQAGSTTNTLSMKVYYNKFDPVMFTDALNVDNTGHEHEGLHGAGGIWPVFGIQKLTSNTSMIPTNWKFETSATITTHMMTETEKNFIRNNVVNRVLKTSETLEYENPEKLINAVTTAPTASGDNYTTLPKPQGEYKEISFDISKFECNCSHILLSLRVPAVDNTNSFAVGNLTKPWPFTKGNKYDAAKTIANATGASSGAAGHGAWMTNLTKKPLFDGWYSGKDGVETAGPLVPENNDGDFMTNSLGLLKHTNYETEPSLSTYQIGAGLSNSNIKTGVENNGVLELPSTGSTTKEFLPDIPLVGYTRDWLHSIELVVGGERTGFIPSSAIKTANLDEFGLKDMKDSGIYVIKLADEAFSTSGIPLAKCNNAKLNIRIKTSLFSSNVDAASTISGNTRRPVKTGFNSTSAWTSLGSPKLVATAVGTTVQTTVGGSISFAA